MLSRCTLRSVGMLTRPLRENDEAGDYKNRDDRRSDRAAQRQSAVADRFVEEIANRCSKWPGENKSGPEQKDPRNVCPEIRTGDQRQPDAEYQRAAYVP